MLKDNLNKIKLGKSEFEYKQKTATVPIRVYDNSTLVAVQRDIDPFETPILLFAGLGVHKRPIGDTLRHFAKQGIYGAGVDVLYNRLPATELAVEKGWREIPHVVFKALSEESGNVRFDTVGHSGGGGVLGFALDENNEPFGNIALVQPPGIHEALNSTDENSLRKRRRNFLFRFAVSGFKQPIELESLHIGRVALETIADVLLSRRYRANINTILTILPKPMLEALAAHKAEGFKVGIFSGSGDNVFPAAEMEAVLNKIQDPSRRPELMIDEGTAHVALNSRQGQKLLNKAVKYVRTTT